MGYRKVPTIYTLTFEQYEGLVVRMKGLKIGKIRKLVRNIDEEDDAKGIDEMLAMVLDGLVSWNLEDEEGNPVPADREQVEDLEFSMLNDIVSKWLDVLTGPDEDLKKDSPGGEKFPGRPLTMEAL